MAITSVNPATGEEIETFEEYNVEKIDQILEETHADFLEWKKTDFEHREELMRKAAEVLRKNKEKYAKHMALEMGKAIIEGEAEVEKCAWVCEYYAENTKEFFKHEMIETDASKSYVRFDPLGTVLAVMPWNYPFWQVFRFAAPALMAGNAGVLKHASNVQRCALDIEEVFQEAGFPKNIFRTLVIKSRSVEHVINHPTVAAATLTGSDAAGRSVASLCGKALKKTVMELGGSDPFIILPDADLEKCVAGAATGRFMNCGQSCIASKRFIVHKDLAMEFEHLFKAAVESKIVGDPLDKSTQIGPMARVDLMKEVDEQVQESIKKGAEVVTGGKPLGEGAFYEPTILTKVKKGMPAYDEETFGPVAAIITYETEEEAIEIANDTPFGLGSSIWTEDIKKAEELAPKINAGAVFINSFTKSDPRLPFGGVKESGYGRELSHYGIKEFVNIKTVVVK